MAEVVHEDVLEQVLIELDVKDLILCKRVCKSWYSLITTPRFIKRHLNRSYNKDRCNDKIGHRRIVLINMADQVYTDHYLVGSSNGLVCISPRSSKVVLGNPLTKEVRDLRVPSWIGFPYCWGFGYDASADDYKLIIGIWKGKDQVCLAVLSLKSNIWKVNREVVLKYVFLEKVGILCNGALHWIVRDEDWKIYIICYDLSTEEFKEIPQPDYDAGCEATSFSYLGIIKECLCIYVDAFSSSSDIWLMKHHNVKQSWELLPRDCEMASDMVHHLIAPKDNIESNGFYHDDSSWFSRTMEYTSDSDIDAPIYVQSLVSPHTFSNRSTKLDKGAPSASGPKILSLRWLKQSRR